jgi:branched-chain amino acid transport system permease protein
MSGLAVDGIVKRFRGLRALDGVSLSVQEGEIVGLIGPNGSGKTTLLNVASGVLEPTEGRVSVDELDATGRKPHELARLGVGRTFQQIRLFAEMTVAENVEVGAVARKQDRQRVPLLLERLGLEKETDRLAVTLAYGQQRRVEIARALGGPSDRSAGGPGGGRRARPSPRRPQAAGRRLILVTGR